MLRFIFLLCSHGILATKAPLKVLNDGNKMPMLALGTGRGTAYGIPTTEVRSAVLWAIEAGYRHIDTAAVYEDEDQVGLGIADAISQGIVTREQLFVTTKLWCDKHAEDQVVPALKESLTRLGLDYVDLYLIHFPMSFKSDGSPDNIDYLKTWKGMEKSKELGLTRSIGVSNFNSSQIIRVWLNSKIKPAVNEIEVNPTLTQQLLVTLCQYLNTTIMGYSPFGFMVSRRKHKESPPPGVDDPALVKIGEKYGKSTLQVVLRYLIERDIVPIPKSTNKERIEKNIDIFDFKLTDEEIETIGQFNKNFRVIVGDQWRDYPYYPFQEYELNEMRTSKVENNGTD